MGIVTPVTGYRYERISRWYGIKNIKNTIYIRFWQAKEGFCLLSFGVSVLWYNADYLSSGQRTSKMSSPSTDSGKAQRKVLYFLNSEDFLSPALL
jgi:hypothetical protein